VAKLLRFVGILGGSAGRSDNVPWEKEEFGMTACVEMDPPCEKLRFSRGREIPFPMATGGAVAVSSDVLSVSPLFSACVLLSKGVNPWPNWALAGGNMCGVGGGVASVSRNMEKYGWTTGSALLRQTRYDSDQRREQRRRE